MARKKVPVRKHPRRLPSGKITMVKAHTRDIDAKSKKRTNTRARAQEQTLFKEARYKKYSNIVKMDTPENAKSSVKTLQKEFNEGEQAKKRRIIRVTTLASNRAGAASKKKNLSQKEKREYRQIQTIYGVAKDTFVVKYAKLYS